MYVTLSPFVGGAERSLLRIAGAIGEKGYEPTIVAGCRGDFPWALEQRGLPYRVLPLKEPNLAWPVPFTISLVRLLREMRRSRPAVVHVNDVPAYIVPGLVASWLKLPRICHIRFTYAPDGLEWYLKHGFEMAVFASQFMKELHREKCPALFPDSRCTVIHNGFDPPSSPPGSVTLDLRRVFGLSDQARVVGFVGQVIAVKGVEEFLLMAARLLRREDGLQFLVVGDDKQEGSSYRLQMETMAQELGIADHCVFVGFRSDVWELLHLCELIVMPSRFEPLGNVAIEAGAAGRPVVACATGGIPEIVVDGETGLLVPQGSVEALEQQVWRVLSDAELQRRLGTAARARIVDRFSLTRQIRSLAEIYDRVAGPGDRPR